jgi:hypothetical protein
VNFDMSEVSALADDLARAPARNRAEASKVMSKTSTQVLRRMKQDFSGHRYSGGVPASLEKHRQGSLGYEIGELDSAGRQWGIAAILAYGTSNNAPVLDHTAALHAEAPLMEKYLGDAAEESVLGRDRS